MNGTSGSLALNYKLEDCEIGVQKSITVLVTPTVNDDESGFAADVNEVVDYEKHDGEKKPYDKGMKGHAPAVAIVIGTKKK